MEVHVGCSGWFYQHWKGLFYPEDLAKAHWFSHYARVFGTVELNAPFYRWPTEAVVRGWAQKAPEGFLYSVKVNRLITHLKRLNGTEQLISDFCGLFTQALGAKMGRFLFQMPPSHAFSARRLEAVVKQLEPRCCIEFRHRSWWRQEVLSALDEAGILFCSVGGLGMPGEVIKSASEVYLRLHGQAYSGDYPNSQLKSWAARLKGTHAARVWVYFNNDVQGFAVSNALAMAKLLKRHA